MKCCNVDQSGYEFVQIQGNVKVNAAAYNFDDNDFDAVSDASSEYSVAASAPPLDYVGHCGGGGSGGDMLHGGSNGEAYSTMNPMFNREVQTSAEALEYRPLVLPSVEQQPTMYSRPRMYLRKDIGGIPSAVYGIERYEVPDEADGGEGVGAVDGIMPVPSSQHNANRHHSRRHTPH